MLGLNLRKILIPILTLFLLLSTDAFIISRMATDSFLYRDSTGLHVPPFRTKDLRGNTVTQDIFLGKFTVVCLWVTRDMDTGRELLASINHWRHSTHEPIQIIGIVGDVKEDADDTQIATARSISAVFPDVPQLIANDDFTALLTRIRNSPTVFFVDTQGNLVGQPVIGNEPVLIQKEILRLMEYGSDGRKLQKKIQTLLFHP